MALKSRGLERLLREFLIYIVHPRGPSHTKYIIVILSNQFYLLLLLSTTKYMERSRDAGGGRWIAFIYQPPIVVLFSGSQWGGMQQHRPLLVHWPETKPLLMQSM